MPAITNEHVRRRLRGVRAYIEADEEPTEAYTEAVSAAHREFERRMQIRIDPTVIHMSPGSGEEAGVDYDAEEPALSYLSGSITQTQLPRWHTPSRPIISVESCRLAFDNDLVVLEIPDAWLRVDKRMGCISVLPLSVSAIASQMGAWYAPLLDRAWPWKLIPQFVRIDYTAGYADPLTNPELDDMRIALSRAAAIVVLRDFERLIPQAEALDGFSQSFTTVDQMIQREQKLVDDFIADWQKQNRPPRMVVI